jgi:hypothetical protein
MELSIFLFHILSSLFVKGMDKYARYKKDLRYLIFSASVVADIMSLATFAKKKKNCYSHENNDSKINQTRERN